MRFLIKIVLLVLIAVIVQMSTDVIRIAWSYPMDFCSAAESSSEQAVAIQDVTADFNQRCTATKWIVTKVIELPLDQSMPAYRDAKSQPNNE